ncbi:hypothetical protein NYP20_22875 [Pseudomonas sp. N3-W]|jgi:hypothetical protein|uniref:Heme utilization protein n=1 Tax=Pseudomonas fungipugnans TaxID=3024217 RepID=A0ABT6QLK0_9PSED|nr:MULTISPECIES: hypothetical protein [unclassified Pseudomonas]MDI2591660.1 hypothetical protein [Pseudomonas sp. 681]UWF48126.1 hypothetical protein NYP20_22875 [Pseudomonas sp. N3-W]
MKTRLMFALALSVLAANAFADDGFDKTGTAAFISQSTSTQSGSSVASDGFDHTGTAGAVAASGGGNGGADGSDKTALGRIDS